MSAFVMALAAGLVLGSGPEEVSAEIKPPLAPRREWKGGSQALLLSTRAV